MTSIIENIEATDASVTATVCENAALYGATPERDEFDTRDVWDGEDAIDAVHESFRILAQGVGPDGFQLADERESLLWGFVNMLDARPSASTAPPTGWCPRCATLQRGQDGTEIKSRELELVTDRAQKPRQPARRLRDHARRSRRGLPGSRPAACGGPGADRTPARPAS